jgi:hypothetical protein
MAGSPSIPPSRVHSPNIEMQGDSGAPIVHAEARSSPLPDARPAVAHMPGHMASARLRVLSNTGQGELAVLTAGGAPVTLQTINAGFEEDKALLHKTPGSENTTFDKGGIEGYRNILTATSLEAYAIPEDAAIVSQLSGRVYVPGKHQIVAKSTWEQSQPAVDEAGNPRLNSKGQPMTKNAWEKSQPAVDEAGNPRLNSKGQPMTKNAWEKSQPAVDEAGNPRLNSKGQPMTKSAWEKSQRRNNPA